MIDHVDVNRKIRQLVVYCTGMAAATIRPSDQLGPATGDQWATVKIISVRIPGSSANLWSDVSPTQVKETQHTQYQITASIQFFRSGALAAANKLRDRVTLSSALQLMQDLGLGYVSAKPVRNLAEVVNSNWEERAQLDIDFHIGGTEEDTINSFAKFPVSVSNGNSSTSTEVKQP